jgi:hypothetical protein
VAGTLGMALNFDSKEWRFAGNTSSARRCIHDLNGMHWFWLHPVDAPYTGVVWTVFARTVANCAVRGVVANVRRSAPGIPVQEETGPPVVMHRLCHAGRRNGDFEHSYKFVLEDNFVAIRRGLYSVVAVGEASFVLSVKIEISS